MVIDLSAGSQSYIEDCEVCCRPIQIHYSCDEDDEESMQFEARQLE
jgi:hypothetical protein